MNTFCCCAFAGTKSGFPRAAPFECGMRDALPVAKGRKIAKPTPGGERTFPGQPVLLSEGVVSLSFLVIRSMVLGGAVPLSVGLYSASSQRESASYPARTVRKSWEVSRLWAILVAAQHGCRRYVDLGLPLTCTLACLCLARVSGIGSGSASKLSTRDAQTLV